jgi:FixJ family two-component response regulator
MRPCLPGSVGLPAFTFFMAIYILEGDPGVNDSLRVLLGSLGHRVFPHRDGVGFFRCAPPAPDDYVIVDLALPVVGGATVIRWLQRLVDPPRILAISGAPQAAIDAQLRGLRAVPVLRKPLREAEIVDQLFGPKKRQGDPE